MNFTTLPTLTTERLTLRQLVLADQQGIFALRSDPMVNKYLGRQPCQSIADAILFINKVNDNIARKSALYWAITLTETNTLAGTICLFDFSTEKSSCEIGYELTPKFQGKGFMQEALQVVVTYAFQALQLANILACTHVDNQHSTNLLVKFNFVPSAAIVEENPDLRMYTLAK